LTHRAAPIAAAALIAYPLIAPALGPGLSGAEAFGLHPDPTAIATLAILSMALRRPAAWLAIAIPFLWCLIATLTLIPLNATWAPIPLAAAIAATATLMMSASTRTTPPNHSPRHPQQ